MPDSNHSQTLFTAAEAYLALGYSVIPVWGDADPARPKVAGVEWAIYQRRRPSRSEIHTWFLESGFLGLAIVTGSISRLVVLDFDTPEGFHDFSARHPHLVERQVIQTRRGYHIYYHLPPHLHFPSRRGQGVDLLSDGRYVIARPSTIDGHTYKLIRGGMPVPLTQADIESINRFFDNTASMTATTTPKREFDPFSFDSGGIQKRHRYPQTPLEALCDLQTSYRQLVEQGGRNNALFQVSLQARDSGASIYTVLSALADLHVSQPTSATHRPETPSQRYIETRRTVQSAFSRPPRLQRQPPAVDSGQLPNNVREKLFQLGETKVVRVIEGLRLKGIKPGQVFTTNEALDLLKGLVGRDSVYAALKVAVNQPLFGRQNPSPAPPTPANAATKTQIQTNKCFIGRGEKSGKSLNHRPAVHYIMPNNDDLCLRLGVKPSRSDPISLDDLATAKKTRMAAHRELIRRRPGHYPRRWLARRLGMSCETLDTYNREIPGLHFRPCFWEQPITWSTLNAVPDGIDIGGAVLMDEAGKRYPAKRRIAAILLGQGRQIIYRRQDVNYYWYGDDISNPDLKHDLQPKVPELKTCREPETQLKGHNAHLQTLSPPLMRHNTASEPVFPHRPLAAMPVPHLSYQRPLLHPGWESLAIQVYEVLNSRCTASNRRISQATARRLVATYGDQAIEAALKLLAKRHNIDRPVGFFITLLRSENKRAAFQQP